VIPSIGLMLSTTPLNVLFTMFSCSSPRRSRYPIPILDISTTPWIGDVSLLIVRPPIDVFSASMSPFSTNSPSIHIKYFPIFSFAQPSCEGRKKEFFTLFPLLTKISVPSFNISPVFTNILSPLPEGILNMYSSYFSNNLCFKIIQPHT